MLRFRDREIELGRTDLIFPFTFANIQDLDPGRNGDCYDPDVFRLLLDRQATVFHELRYQDVNSWQVRARIGEFATTIRSALRRSAPPSVVSAVSFLDQPIDDRERRAKVKAQAQASEAAREAKANRKADEIKRLAEEPRTADEATHTTELKRKSGEECRLTVEPREATKVMLPADDREGSRSTSGKRRRLPVLALVAAGTVALSVAGYITFTPSKVTVAPARRPTIIRRPPEVVSAPEVSVTPAPPLTPPAAPVTKPPDVPLERMPEKIIRDCDQGCPRMVLIPERGVFHGNPSG